MFPRWLCHHVHLTLRFRRGGRMPNAPADHLPTAQRRLQPVVRLHGAFAMAFSTIESSDNTIGPEPTTAHEASSQDSLLVPDLSRHSAVIPLAVVQPPPAPAR